MNTYTDQYGKNTGWVGGKYQNTYSDGYGGTTGRSATSAKHYDDGYGNTTGTIGRDRINLHTDRSGVTTGTIAQRRLNCEPFYHHMLLTRLLAVVLYPFLTAQWPGRSAYGKPCAVASAYSSK